MKRIRWLSAQCPEFLKTLAPKMKGNPFTQESYDGFIVGRVRENSIEARYIEKLAYQETIKDPFDNEQVFDRVTYRQVIFNLFGNFPHIELKDPPRSTHSYISKLLELSNFSLSVNHIQVNLIDWVETIQAQIKTDIIINAIQIGGLDLEEGVSAKVLVKGNKDVRSALNNFVRDKKYILEKLRLTIYFDRDIVPIQLGNNGTAKIPDDVFEDILPLLRNSLPNPVIL